MPRFWDEYHLPTSFEAAVTLLARYDGRARIIAGGTDLLLDLKDAKPGGHQPHYDALIDVTRIAGANEIREEDGWVVIGCAVTHTQVVAHPLMCARASALAEASGVVAGAQVRNIGTVVGNIAHALPAADSAIALAVLGAEAQVKSSKAKGKSEEWMPIASLYLGPGESAVDSTREIISAIRFRLTGASEASAFTRVMRPQGIALPILGMAARVRGFQISDFRFQIEDVSISAGPVAPVLFRATQTEAFLRGKEVDATTLDEAGRVLLAEAKPRTSAHRATKEYRFELLPTMLREVVTRAVERAKTAK